MSTLQKGNRKILSSVLKIIETKDWLDKKNTHMRSFIFILFLENCIVYSPGEKVTIEALFLAFTRFLLHQNVDWVEKPNGFAITTKALLNAKGWGVSTVQIRSVRYFTNVSLYDEAVTK